MNKIERQVGGYLAYCENVRGMTEATLRQKRNVLGRFVRVTRVRDLGRLDNVVFNRWVKSVVGGGVSARSVNAYNAVVLAMVRYYRGVGVVIPLNIALIGKLKEGRLRRRFYTREEVARVLERADEETGLMIRVLFETGMRIAELVWLRVGDFTERGLGSLGRKIEFIGKGRRPREVYLRVETVVLLTEYVRKYDIRGYLWSVMDGVKTLNGEPPTVNTVRERLKREFVRAGFEDFYPHALRHSFATNLQVNGASVGEIKEMIGHSSVATTERYLHGFEGRLMELFDKYA